MGPFSADRRLPGLSRAASRLLTAFVLLAAGSAAADDLSDVTIQRYLVSLHLGDELEQIHMVYPPAREWPSYREPRTRVDRIRVDRGAAKYMPVNVETLWLGLKGGRLVDIQVVYDAGFTRRRPADEMAGNLALIYGEPGRTEGKYWWTDGRTVIRTFYKEIPVLKEGSKAVELRTSLQLIEARLFH